MIRPHRGWVPIDLPELWRYRELIGFLARSDGRLVRADAATRLAALAIASGQRWPAAAARIALVGCRLSPRAFGRSALAVVRGGTNAWHRSPIFVEARP